MTRDASKPGPREGQGAIGVADLVRSLGVLQTPDSMLAPEELAEVGRVLGYERVAYRLREPEEPQLPNPPRSGPASISTAPDDTDRQGVLFAPVPLLRQVEAIAFGAPDASSLQPSGPLRSRTAVPLANLLPPKAPSRWRSAAIVPRLFRLTSTYPPIGALDLRQIVRHLSEIRAFDQIPRRPRRRMVDRLRVILDRSIALAPWWSDGDVIADWLLRWGPAPQVEVLRLAWGSPQWPAPNSQLRTIIVTDAGGCATQTLRQAWMAEGRRRTAAGEPTVLWLLGPATEELRNGWNHVVGDRSAPSDRVPDGRHQDVERLLAVASLAHQVDADLLRELRMVLGIRDPLVELLAWRHPDVRHGTTTAGRWTPEAFRGYRSALRQGTTSWLTLTQFRSALERIAKYRVLGTPKQKAPLVWWAPESIWQLEVSSWQTFATELPPAYAACLRSFIEDRGWLQKNAEYLGMLEASAHHDGQGQAVPKAQLRRWLDALKLYEPTRSWSEPDGRFYSVAAALFKAEPLRPLQLSQAPSGLHLDYTDTTKDRVIAASPITVLESRQNSGLFEAGGQRQTLRLNATTALDLPGWREPLPAHGRDEFGRWSVIEIAGVSVRMRWIEPGTFLMGSPKNETGRDDDEGPQHAVTLSEGYWLAETPCTQALWRAVMRENPSEFKGNDRPVESVSWNDVSQFIAKVNAAHPELGMRLPTEAQWEYAARAGTTQARYGELDAIAWYDGNTNGETRPVGQKAPNAWGLYDVLGNVWEWCHDGMRAYDSGHAYDPIGGTVEGTDRVLRGGCWGGSARSVRAAIRNRVAPSDRFPFYGFRLSRGQDALSRGPEGRARDAAPARDGRSPSGAGPVRQSEGSRVPNVWTHRSGARQLSKKLSWEEGEDQLGAFADVVLLETQVLFRMRWIEPGTFLMGSSEDEEGRNDREGPQHHVTLRQGFWLADAPCTQVLYEAITGENPARFKGADRPVENVSWEDAQAFLDAFNKNQGLDLTLPTEAQWEYACRAGTAESRYRPRWFGGNDRRTAASGIATRARELADSGELSDRERQILEEVFGGKKNAAIAARLGIAERTVKFHIGNINKKLNVRNRGELMAQAGTTMRYGELDAIAWYDGNANGETRPVRQKQPNAWGLYDMLGNVWEWCHDGMRTYDSGHAYDPIGPAEGTIRVLRGGSWSDLPAEVACGQRSASTPRTLRSGARTTGSGCPEVPVRPVRGAGQGGGPDRAGRAGKVPDLRQTQPRPLFSPASRFSPIAPAPV